MSRIKATGKRHKLIAKECTLQARKKPHRAFAFIAKDNAFRPTRVKGKTKVYRSSKPLI